MATLEEILSDLIETRESIKNNSYGYEEALGLLSNFTKLIDKNEALQNFKKYSLIKSFLVTFNLSNFADITIILNIKSDKITIIDYAGDNRLFNEFKKTIENEKDFFRNTDSFSFHDDNYRLYFEMMQNNNGDYIILSITQSSFFKPSSFHMMCDIILDIIRYSDFSRESVYNDLFENNIIDINRYISENNLNDSHVFLFMFENISGIYKKMGFQMISELSDVISGKLKVIFGNNSGIFRFSLSEYIVISPGDVTLKRGSYDFTFNGIVLNYRFSKMPFRSDQSIYDVFENIFNLHKSKSFINHQ